MSDLKKLFSLYVKITDSFDVESPLGCVRQILFDGEAKGEYFNGIVLPGGVDTQRKIGAETGFLSARYILEGTDIAGEKCRIFVENTAEFDNNITSPQMYTDSKALSFIHDAHLEGNMRFEKDGLYIDIMCEI